MVNNVNHLNYNIAIAKVNGIFQIIVHKVSTAYIVKNLHILPAICRLFS